MYSLILSVRPNFTTDVPTNPSGTSDEDAWRLRDVPTADMRNTRTLLALENYHKMLYIEAIPEEYLVRICSGNLRLAYVTTHPM